MAVEFLTVKGRRQGECGARDPFGIKGRRRKGAHLVRFLHHSSTNQGTFNELVAWSLALLVERIYQKIERGFLECRSSQLRQGPFRLRLS
eukprot:scaffold117_cov345-Pavlova_lutheri.AAC.1